MSSLELDPKSTALVLIDLQQGIVAGQTVPRAFGEDAMAAREEDLHTFPVTRVFPTIGRVRSTDDVLASLA
jgi:nicotinamidase-related amidase